MPLRLSIAIALSLALHGVLLLPDLLKRLAAAPPPPPLQATLRLPPKPEVIRPLDGQGHTKLMFPMLTGLYVCPWASAFFFASSSWRFSSASICLILSSWALMSAW